MQRALILAAAAALAAFAATADDAALRAAALIHFEAIPSNPPALDGDVATRAHVDLGTKLFLDPRISRSGIFSCNSCRNVGMGGVDGLETSISHGWQKGPRTAPTLFNAVVNIAQFWDGRAPDLAAQAKGPVQAGVEMNNTPERAEQTLASMPGYVDAFAAAFPGEANPVGFDNMAKAIETFEAMLITPNSRFDQFLLGDDKALSDQEKSGLAAFLETGCAACHAGVNLGGREYHPFGVREKPGAAILPVGDRGRFAVTATATDDHVFRAGPLRNIDLTAPCFHLGTVWNLEDAVAVMGRSQLAAPLSDAQIADITAFLTSLTGEIPEVKDPAPPVRTAQTPLPDPM